MNYLCTCNGTNVCIGSSISQRRHSDITKLWFPNNKGRKLNHTMINKQEEQPEYSKSKNNNVPGLQEGNIIIFYLVEL